VPLRSVLCAELGPRESLRLLYRYVTYKETCSTVADELGLHSASRGVPNVPGLGGGVGWGRLNISVEGEALAGQETRFIAVRLRNYTWYIVVTFRLNCFLSKILSVQLRINVFLISYLFSFAFRVQMGE
jgi:hypothetical protein